MARTKNKGKKRSTTLFTYEDADVYGKYDDEESDLEQPVALGKEHDVKLDPLITQPDTAAPAVRKRRKRYQLNDKGVLVRRRSNRTNEERYIAREANKRKYCHAVKREVQNPQAFKTEDLIFEPKVEPTNTTGMRDISNIGDGKKAPLIYAPTRMVDAPPLDDLSLPSDTTSAQYHDKTGNVCELQLKSDNVKVKAEMCGDLHVKIEGA